MVLGLFILRVWPGLCGFKVCYNVARYFGKDRKEYKGDI